MTAPTPAPTLKKATLTPISKDGGEPIVFMFNPTELKFSRTMNIEQAQGATTRRGQNKSSFKHPNPYQLTISNIMLDTYEEPGEVSVLDKLKPFTAAVVFVQGAGSAQGQAQASPGSQGQARRPSAPERRPPIYLFSWGETQYMRCFVKSFNFRLTMFLSTGTPVRAIVDLTLEQAEDPNSRPSQGTPAVTQAQRQNPSLFLE